MNFIVRWRCVYRLARSWHRLRHSGQFRHRRRGVRDCACPAQYGREAYSPSAKPAYHGAYVWPVLSGREYGNAVLGIGYLGWAVRR